MQPAVCYPGGATPLAPPLTPNSLVRPSERFSCCLTVSNKSTAGSKFPPIVKAGFPPSPLTGAPRAVPASRRALTEAGTPGVDLLAVLPNPAEFSPALYSIVIGTICCKWVITVGTQHNRRTSDVPLKMRTIRIQERGHESVWFAMVLVVHAGAM